MPLKCSFVLQDIVEPQVFFVLRISILLCSKPARVPSSFRRIQAKFLGEFL